MLANPMNPSIPMPSPLPRRPKGFSLVEVALALAVMGLIGAMTFPLLSHLLTQQKVNRAEIILESARSEVLGFAMRSKNLPAAITSIGHQQDAWRTNLEYRLSTDVGVQNLCTFFSVTTGETELKLDRSGTTVENVAFILVSSGPNRLLQTNLLPDTVVIPDPGTEVDGKRFDDLHVFMTMDYLRTRIDCP
jgi:prepilin-type N-terminal cleavage/methylation domain-containing protein